MTSLFVFQYGNEAKAFGEVLRQRLDKFGLKISEEKSRIIEFGRAGWQKTQRQGKKVATFDFLGFTHYSDKTRRGKFKLVRKTARSKFIQKMKMAKECTQHGRDKGVVVSVEVKVRGALSLLWHQLEYALVEACYKHTLRLAYKWINRRSQKRSYNWTQFSRFLKYNPLPPPRICHLTYTLSSY